MSKILRAHSQYLLGSKMKDEDQEERRRDLELTAKYNQRITIAKVARNAFTAKNYTLAIKHYTEYLTILAHSKEIEDIFTLSPSDFDEKTPVSELLLISHVYWDLARMYASSANYLEYQQKSLAQFVKFTANQPYQVLNSEMVRKFIKKRTRAKDSLEYLEILSGIHSQIFTESNSCFIASYAFGYEHKTTYTLRQFKAELLDWPFGVTLVRIYYKYSPALIDYIVHKRSLNYFTRLTIVPILRIFAFFTQTSIFRSCSSFLKLLQNLGSNRS